MAAFLAGVVMVAHFAALFYIGFGGFIAWKWPKTIFIHLLLAAWGIAVNVLPLTCPLTAAEDYLRDQQGLGPLPGGFNEYYIYDTLIPTSQLPLAALIAIGCFLVSYAGLAMRWFRHKSDGTPPSPRTEVRLG